MFVGVRRTKAQTTDPATIAEEGPNGHRIGYTDEGDKVEFIPDDENPGEEWPMVLRRGEASLYPRSLSTSWEHALASIYRSHSLAALIRRI